MNVPAWHASVRLVAWPWAAQARWLLEETKPGGVLQKAYLTCSDFSWAVERHRLWISSAKLRRSVPVATVLLAEGDADSRLES